MPNAASVAAELPDYAHELQAFHRAFAAELRQLVARLPLNPTDRVIDVGCGDGFYSAMFAERLRRPGVVIGLDVNEAYLEQARRRLASRYQAEVRLICADWREAVAAVGEPCDLVWCAQSLFSLAEPTDVLRSFAKLVRPGGLVVVLENDTLHQLLMPWSSRMEMEIRTAERRAFEQESPHPGKFYVGRRIPATMAAAGLEPLGYFTQSIDRTAPLGDDLERFLHSYLEGLLMRTGPYLSPQRRRELSELLRPESEQYLLHQPYFTMTWLNVLAWGRRPV
jgi:ubiquinone/menaquinone biosynthesis C-methylase UbiE